LLRILITQKRSAKDAQRCAANIIAYGNSHLAQQSGASPSKIEGYREFEADLSALFHRKSYQVF